MTRYSTMSRASWVGLFLAVAALRIRKAVPLRRMLVLFYLIVFAVAGLAMVKLPGFQAAIQKRTAKKEV